MPEALQRIVARLLVSPPDTVAVAGAVFVRNSRENLLTRAQEWDYFLGIASVKRQQGLLRARWSRRAPSASTDRARSTSRRLAGRIGEDIVLTWAMMREGGRRQLRADRHRVHRRPGDAKALRRASAAAGRAA